MKDTSDAFAAVVARRHAALSPVDRMRAAAAMYDAAVRIVEASLPASLSLRERRVARAMRLYGEDFTPPAFDAHANWLGSTEIKADGDGNALES